MRIFLAIELPATLRQQVYEFLSKERKHDLPIKWVKPVNLHITLKFIGEITEQKIKDILPVIKTVSERHKQFAISLEDFGCFPSIKSPKVLWIGVKSGTEQLTALAMDIESSLIDLACKPEKRFHGHLTVGRIKKICDISEIVSKHFSAPLFIVDGFTLFKSSLMPEGPVYQALYRFKLKKN